MPEIAAFYGMWKNTAKWYQPLVYFQFVKMFKLTRGKKLQRINNDLLFAEKYICEMIVFKYLFTVGFWFSERNVKFIYICHTTIPSTFTLNKLNLIFEKKKDLI